MSTPSNETLARIAMMEAFCERHGIQAADGVYVAGRDKVYFCCCTQSPATPKEMRLPFDAWPQETTADQVEIQQLHAHWYSTAEAAEAAARKEWER